MLSLIERVRTINKKTARNVLKVVSMAAAIFLFMLIIILAKALDSRIKDGKPRYRDQEIESSILREESEAEESIESSITKQESSEKSSDEQEEWYDDWSEESEEDSVETEIQESKLNQEESSVINDSKIENTENSNQLENSSSIEESQESSENSSFDSSGLIGSWGVADWD